MGLKQIVVVGIAVLSVTLLLTSHSGAGSDAGYYITTFNSTGLSQTYSTVPLDLSNPFFQSLGTNGRSCSSCHQPTDAFTITPPRLRERFRISSGTDPVFRPNDGAVCPAANVSTVEDRREAYRLLLQKGLIRVSMSVPADADFTLLRVDDPYHCSTAADVALFRRPLPSTNLKFLSAVMWDGRESSVPNRDITGDLGSQAIDATTGHAQASAPPTTDQVNQIVAFESALSSAQIVDFSAGYLAAYGAGGGPLGIVKQNFYIGINDVLGGDPTGAKFNPNAFSIYATWANSHEGDRQLREGERSVARGEDLFNNFPINISGVGGLNDKLGIPVIAGTCTTCHDSPNAGNHSVKLPINIGTAEASIRTQDMPLYTFQCASGAVVQTTDPGRAMISGKCADIGKFKGPILRNLAARAPYFHNGMAADFSEVLDFYKTRFQVNLTPQQRRDLIAFLKTL